MTKMVRIENADISSYKIVVEVWDKGFNGNPDVKAWEEILSHPTAMTGGNVYVTNTRYIVVKEVE